MGKLRIQTPREMQNNQNMELNLANNSSVQPRYMSVKSVSVYLGVSRRTIYRWIDKGLIPYCTIPSGYRFDKEEIDRWMKTHHVPEAGLPEIKEF